MYGHPESYPPTLNAISCLAEQYEIKVVCRAHQVNAWPYPAGVEVLLDGPVLPAPEQEKLPIGGKIKLFLRFCRLYWHIWQQYQPQVLLFYDSLSILAYRLGASFNFSRPILWYHNHDVYEPGTVRKYSLTWWSLRAEKWIFPRLQLFSLPAIERQRFFPMRQLKGSFFLLPNYPAKAFYPQFYQKRQPVTEIRLLFQGQVGSGHGIEEIIDMLPYRIANIPLKLVLKGAFRSGYDQWILSELKRRQLEAWVELHGYTPYAEVPKLGSGCHIGLAIFTKQDAMNQTLGTASNKIYEYAAMGLPIIYYDSLHFRKHLEQYSWAIPSDLSSDSLQKALETIIENYEQLAEFAFHDFMKTLNFEHHFNPILHQLEQKI